MIFNEIWKQFNSEVEVSSFGNVRSIDRVVAAKNGAMIRCKSKLFAPAIDKKGYKRVAFKHNGKHTTFKVHRLVASLFVENAFGKIQVNHLDGDKQNNYYQNLCWATNKENVMHAYQTGLIRPKYMHEHHRCKLDANSIELIFKMRADGVSFNKIANTLGIASSTVKGLYKRNEARINSKAVNSI